MAAFSNSILGRRRKKTVALIRRRPDPTDDLYVGLPLRDLRSEYRLRAIDLDKNPPPDAPRGAHAAVISRYIASDMLAWLKAHRNEFHRVIYLFDDDLAIVGQADELPENYRHWICNSGLLHHQELLDFADFHVVTSPWLLEKYRSPKTRLLEPIHYNALPTTLEHHDRPRSIEILYVGSTTHARDLEAIAPAIGATLNNHGQARFTTIGNPPPGALADHPRVSYTPMMAWNRFKRRMAGLRAHIGLVPMLDGEWNRAKSMIKMIDYAQVGAAVLAAPVAPYDRLFADGKAGRLAPMGPDAWRAALEELVLDHQARRQLAENAVRLTARLADPARASEFWRAILD